MGTLKSLATLVVMILLIVVGNKYLNKKSIAVVSGSATVNPSSDISNPVGSITQTNEIFFPAGYNKDNCIVISIGRKRNTWSGEYGYGAGTFDASSMVSGCLPTSIVFMSNNTCRLQFANIGSSTLTILYKIVFMKID